MRERSLPRIQLPIRGSIRYAAPGCRREDSKGVVLSMFSNDTNTVGTTAPSLGTMMQADGGSLRYSRKAGDSFPSQEQ